MRAFTLIYISLTVWSQANCGDYVIFTGRVGNTLIWEVVEHGGLGSLPLVIGDVTDLGRLELERLDSLDDRNLAFFGLELLPSLDDAQSARQRLPVVYHSGPTILCLTGTTPARLPALQQYFADALETEPIVFAEPAAPRNDIEHRTFEETFSIFMDTNLGLQVTDVKVFANLSAVTFNAVDKSSSIDVTDTIQDYFRLLSAKK